MRVSIVQNEIKWGIRDQNLHSFGTLLKQLYNQTDLVVLPEMFSTGFAVDNPKLAESEKGKTFVKVKQ